MNLIIAPGEAQTEFEIPVMGMRPAGFCHLPLDDELVFRQGKHIEAAVSLEKLSKSYKTTLDKV